MQHNGRILCLHPEIFDDLYSLPLTNNAVHGPLHLLKLDIHPATCIPENMISCLSSLVERGVKVNVLSKPEDILQSSIEFYRRKRGSKYQDWTDNMDSNLFSWLLWVISVWKVKVNASYLNQPGRSDKYLMFHIGFKSYLMYLLNNGDGWLLSVATLAKMYPW